MSKAKYILIELNIPDRFNFKLTDCTYEILAQCEQTYIPDWLPIADSDSDLRLIIDLETGRIVNWKKPTDSELREAIQSYNQED